MSATLSTLPSRGQLIDDLLSSLQEKLRTGKDDFGRDEVWFSSGSRDMVDAFLDRMNDSLNPQAAAEWLGEEAKGFTEEGLRLSIGHSPSLPPISATFRYDGRWIFGFGLTPREAIANAYRRDAVQGTMDEPQESRSSNLLRVGSQNFHD